MARDHTPVLQLLVVSLASLLALSLIWGSGNLGGLGSGNASSRSTCKLLGGP